MAKTRGTLLWEVDRPWLDNLQFSFHKPVLISESQVRQIAVLSQSPLCRCQIFGSFKEHPASGRLTQEMRGAFPACAMALGSALDASATGSERVPGTRAEWNKRSHHVELANYSKGNQTGKSLELTNYISSINERHQVELHCLMSTADRGDTRLFRKSSDCVKREGTMHDFF